MDSGILHVTTGEKTDFWRETHYGFIRDNGHFCFESADGDFTAEVLVAGDYQELYDQGGLMLRLDGRNWIKAGVEFVGGKRLLRVEWAPTESAAFETLRLAYFPSPNPVQIGPMCCSPQRAGFEVRFEGFRVGPPLRRGLHD
jgi:regulation of enolase protein 1 (concanavalin A-like superfamily)